MNGRNSKPSCINQYIDNAQYWRKAYISNLELVFHYLCIISVEIIKTDTPMLFDNLAAKVSYQGKRGSKLACENRAKKRKLFTEGKSMDSKDNNSLDKSSPEFRQEALSLVTSGQKSAEVAKRLGVPKSTLSTWIKEEQEKEQKKQWEEYQERKTKAISLVKSGRTPTQVARTLKTRKWEVDLFIKEIADAEVREKVKEAREAPEFRAKAIILMKSGRTTAQVARTLKAPRWYVDALVKDAMDAESREKAAGTTSEFRAKAVSLVESGQDAMEVAKALGISKQTLDITVQGNTEADVVSGAAIGARSTRNITACPKCQGTEWKLASLVHHEGIQSINSVSSSRGVGITTGGIGVGIGSSNTTGVQQTTLSQLAAPPRVPDSNRDFFLFMLMLACGFPGIFFFIDGISNSEISEFLTGCAFLSVTAFLIRTLWRFIVKEGEQHGKDMSKWRETKMCTRCGHFYN